MQPDPAGALAPAPQAPTLRNRRIAVALLGLLAATLLCLRQFSDPDIWFHLVIGREIAALGALPAQEFYIFGALGEAAHYPAPGFDLLQYALFRLGGWGAMALFNAGAFVATLWLLRRAALTAAPAGPAGPACALALALVFLGLNIRFVFRPEIALFLLLGLELWILERWLARGERRALWLLPLFSWLITQIHTTWILLFLVFGAYATHRLAALAFSPGRSWPALGREAALVLALALAMALLPAANPYGLSQVTVLLPAGLFEGSASATPGAAQLEALASVFGQGANGLVEYLPIFETGYWPHFLLLAVAVAASGLAVRRLRICDILMLLGLGSLAVSNARNIGLFAMACAIPLVHGFTALLAGLERRPAGLWHPAAVYGLAGALAIGATLSEQNWGIGPKPGDMPEAGTRILRNQLPAGNVFNFFHLGGYLAWELGPAFKVAMDGHFVRPTAADALHDRFFRADPDWRRIADDFSVMAIVTPATLPYSGQLIPLVRELARDPQWRLVAVEEAGLTFLREHPAFTAPALAKEAVWQQVLREAEATLAAHPGQAGARDAIAMAQQHLRWHNPLISH
jgi:hypothetical protein